MATKKATKKKATKKKTTSTITKSSITGPMVTNATVQRHPESTVTQTVQKTPNKKPAGT